MTRNANLRALLLEMLAELSLDAWRTGAASRMDNYRARIDALVPEESEGTIMEVAKRLAATDHYCIELELSEIQDILGLAISADLPGCTVSYDCLGGREDLTYYVSKPAIRHRSTTNRRTAPAMRRQ